MNKLAPQEFDLAKHAFKRQFKVEDDIMNTTVVENTISNAPTAIVEFDGLLKGEDTLMADQRKKLFQVYDGDIRPLSSYLRQLYGSDPDMSSLSKWGLIFTVYSGITDVQQKLDQALTEAAFGDAKSDTKTEENSEVESVQAEPVVEESTVPQEVVAPHVVEEQHVEYKATEPDVAKVVEPTGNGQAKVEDPLFNTPKQFNVHTKEEQIMANGLDAMAKAATAVAPAKRAPRTQAQKDQAAIKAAQNKEAGEIIAKAIGSSTEARSAYTRESFVTAIVALKKAAALRIVDEHPVGKIPANPTKTKTSQQDWDQKKKNFIMAVSGKALEPAEFAALPDADKYAMVYGKDAETQAKNVKIAQAMWDIYASDKLENDYPVVIPEKMTVATKGYAIDGQIMNEKDFVNTLVDKSTGELYAAGMLDASGNPKNQHVDEKTGAKKDDSIKFKVVKASKTKNAGKNAGKIASSHSSTPRFSLTVRAVNKSNFIADESNLIYLFPEISDTETETARFKVSVAVDGSVVPAIIPVKTGKQVATKTNGVREVTKTVSITAAVPVYKVVGGSDGIIEEARAGKQNPEVDAYWGVKITKVSKAGVFAAQVNASDISDLPVFGLLVELTRGNAPTAGMENATVAAIEAAKNTKTAETAAAVSDELNA